MFLLRPIFAPQLKQYFPKFTFQYVSIKTDLSAAAAAGYDKFTFQYVSIKTQTPIINVSVANTFTFQYVSIKTKDLQTALTTRKYIYIPICFY